MGSVQVVDEEVADSGSLESLTLTQNQKIYNSNSNQLKDKVLKLHFLLQ